MGRWILLVMLGFAVAVSGCATAPTTRPARRTAPAERVSGIYHEVARGETLFRIAKGYCTSIEEIVRANRLQDASKIEIGQLIFIPGAITKRAILPILEKNGIENFIWPVRGRVVSYFGSTKDLVANKGIDIQAEHGASVAASRSGRVSFSSEKVKGLGKTVIIDHGDGFQTVYAHNSEILTSAGRNVKQGEVIARVGASGVADKPTLHFEIRKDNKACNPFYYLP